MPKVSFDKVQRMWETKHELALVRESMLLLWCKFESSYPHSPISIAEEDTKLKYFENQLVGERLRTKPWNPAYV